MAESGHSGSAALADSFNGLTKVNWLSRLVKDRDEAEAVCSKLALIARHLTEHGSPRFSITGESKLITEAETHLQRLTSLFKTQNGLVAGPTLALDARYGPGTHTFVTAPVQVNYVAAAYPTVPFTHPDSAALALAGQLMNALFLHREIREKGGAYGSGARHTNGLFCFSSYRDPRLDETVAAFDLAISATRNGELTQRNLDEAKLSVFSSIDAPKAPAERGQVLMHRGLTDSMLQDFRERLIAVEMDEVSRVVGQYLSDPSTRSVVAVGPQDTVPEPKWTVLPASSL